MLLITTTSGSTSELSVAKLLTAPLGIRVGAGTFWVDSADQENLHALEAPQVASRNVRVLIGSSGARGNQCCGICGDYRAALEAGAVE